MEILSYINNLDRKHNSDLYVAFARGFECVLPLLRVVTKRPLIGQRLQVITKACNYVLVPGETYQG